MMNIEKFQTFMKGNTELSSVLNSVKDFDEEKKTILKFHDWPLWTDFKER